ncbi:MAG: hypothetical protein WA718_12815 [Terriglobales bacterium]
MVVPKAAVALAVRVNVLLVVVELGLKEAVTPLGKPVAESVTLLLNPFRGLTVMVLLFEVPRTTVTLLGKAEIVKDAD